MSPSAPAGPPPHGRRIAWFHCFAGIAGDMALGSLLDAGADLAEVEKVLARLPIGGWSMDVREVLRGGIGATAVSVEAPDDRVVRTFSHIVGLVEEARLPEEVRERALSAFAALADAEARVHRHSRESAQLHEAGGHDTIVDIVGTSAALWTLDVTEVASSAVATGIGVVRTEHGTLPNPPPAVVALLAGAPTYGRPIGAELTTPTGAAMLAAWVGAWGPMPEMVIVSSGFGAGLAELRELPNCTQVVIGDAAESGAGGRGQEAVMMETTLDDVTPEVLAHTVEAVLAAGAHDAWISAVTMKKGRPGHVLHVLADPALASRLRDLLASETGTLGVRVSALERWPLARTAVTVTVAGHSVSVKLGPHRAKAELDDAARVAALTGLPLREVQRLAEEAARHLAEATGRVAPGGAKDADTSDDDEPPEAG